MMSPGPTIRGKVGDMLVVNLTNDLLTPTTIHCTGPMFRGRWMVWHGRWIQWLQGKRLQLSYGPERSGITPTLTRIVKWTSAYGMLVVEDDDDIPVDHELLLVFDSFEEAEHQRRQSTPTFMWTIVTTWLVNGSGSLKSSSSGRVGG